MTVLAGGAACAIVAAVFAFRPVWLERLPATLVWGAAAGGGVAMALSDAAPTGWIVPDLLGRVLVGVAVPVAVAHLRVGWALWLAVVAAAGLVVGDAGGWEPLGAAGIGLTVGAVASSGRQPVLLAAGAAASLAPLGHLSWPVATGASSLLVAVGVVPLLMAGVRVGPLIIRRALPPAFVALFLLGVGGSIAGGVSALAARTDVDRAVDAAIAGLDEADADDTGPAVEKLREAAASFAAAESTLRAWWARPALLVPGVAQQSRAVSTMAGAGERLATAAADSLDEVDLDSLHPVGGRVDLTRLDEVEPHLTRALDSLRDADERLAAVDSPLLLGPVDDRLEDLAGRVRDARETAEIAAEAVAVAPDLLGGDGPRRYFLVMQTPSELRGIGGFMGSWGELVADDGSLELARTGRVTELTERGPDPAQRRIEGQPEYVAHWGQAPAQYWGIIGFSPDFPTVGDIIAQLYPQSGGSEVDGVIALDPAGFAALLELTGPIAVPGFAERLTPDNAEKILLHDQYLGGEEADREAFLEAAIRILFDELTSGDLPGPRGISAALAPMVDGRHVQLFSTHPGEQRFFERIDADGGVRRSAADGVGMLNQNYNGNKIDYFLRRSLTYDLTWDPSTGEVEGTLEVRLENQAPASGLPHAVIGWGGDLSASQVPVADGENLTYLSLYAAGELTDITVDGAPAELNRIVPELGYNAYDLLVRIPPRGVSVVRADVRLRVSPGTDYSFELLRQATAVPDRLLVRVAVPNGWRVALARSEQPVTTRSGIVVADGDASVPFALDLHAEEAHPDLLERLQGREPGSSTHSGDRSHAIQHVG